VNQLVVPVNCNLRSHIDNIIATTSRAIVELSILRVGVDLAAADLSISPNVVFASFAMQINEI
jgi:hypothetical protein